MQNEENALGCLKMYPLDDQIWFGRKRYTYPNIPEFYIYVFGTIEDDAISKAYQKVQGRDVFSALDMWHSYIEDDVLLVALSGIFDCSCNGQIIEEYLASRYDSQSNGLYKLKKIDIADEESFNFTVDAVYAQFQQKNSPSKSFLRVVK